MRNIFVFLLRLLLVEFMLSSGGASAQSLTDVLEGGEPAQVRAQRAESVQQDIEELARMEKSLGNTHADLIPLLDELGRKLWLLGRPREALPYFERSFHLKSKVLGEKHARTLLTLNRYATALEESGRAAEALPLHERLLDIYRTGAGEKHPNTLRALNNYIVNLLRLGRYAEALPQLQALLAIRMEVSGEKNPATLVVLQNYGVTLARAGQSAEALPYLARNLALRTEVSGEKHPATLSALNTYASALGRLDRHKEALPHLERSLALHQEMLGEKHPQSLVALNTYASALEATSDSPRALGMYQRALALRKEVLGDRHPDTLTSTNNYAMALMATGRLQEALPYYEQFLSGAEKQRDEANRDSAESQRGVLARYLYGYQNYLFALKDAGRLRDALNVLERTKARTLLEQMALRSAVTGSGLADADATRLLDFANRIGSLDTRIAQTAKDSERDALKTERNAASRALAEIKRDLQTRYPRFRQITEVQPAGADDARALLPASGVFVNYIVMAGELVRAISLDAKGQITWHDFAVLPGLADTVEALRIWTANPGGGVMVDDARRSIQILRWMDGSTPRWRVVAAGQACSAQQMHQDKQQSEAATRGPSATRGLDAPMAGTAGADCIPPGATFVSREAQYQELLDYMGKTLLDPVKNQLAGKQQVIISPDGPLGLIPWDVLPLNGKPLIAQFEVSQVQSLSVLKLLKERQAEYGRNKTREALLAMGNPQYGSGGVATERGTGVMTRSPFTTARAGASPVEILRSLKWTNLPGTQVEMERAAKIFAGQSRVVSGKAASETTLRTLSTGGELANYRYLLFAAHGYFDPNLPVYSSLVLAAEGPEPERDGYVTMGEWVGMNLKSELTLLSACNTARGENISGEGLMGLAYALYVAGNTNTVLTLWPVADEETAEFVSSLLTKIKAGQPHAQAITTTKREFLNHDNPRKRSPYFWAPFVLYGM